MAPLSRRALLSGAGVLASGLAGCPRGEPTRTTGDGPATGTTTPSTGQGTSTARSTTATATLRVETVALPPAEAVLVYPENLARWLRTAARDGEWVRGTGSIANPGQPPALFRFESVHLVDAAPAVSGTYRIEGSGGVSYTLHVGARIVEEPPADATVLNASELSPERETFVRSAVNSYATMGPVEPVGAWARRAFLDGYVRVNGTVYTGYEIQQTDAAFFSTRVYYDFRLVPTDEPGERRVRLAVPDLSSDARTALEPLVTRKSRDLPASASFVSLGGAGAEAARSYDYLLTHDTLLRLKVVE